MLSVRQENITRSGAAGGALRIDKHVDQLDERENLLKSTDAWTRSREGVPKKEGCSTDLLPIGQGYLLSLLHE